MHVLTAVILSTCALGGAPSGELLDFTANWCGPCQQMGPIVDRLHRQGYPVRKVDIDENRELARKYNISSIPAFVLVINGKVVDQQVGAQSERDLLQMLARIPKATPEFERKAPDAPLLVEKSPGGGSRTVVIPTNHPNWKPAAQPNRGILPHLFGRRGNDAPDFAQSGKIPDDKVRAKLDDQPLTVEEILTREPLQASIRIRIIDQEGTNLGSGTIIQSKTGHTVILTCGHIFRNFQEDSLVEIDVFQGGQKETFVGKHIQHDLKLDLGLISIATDNPLPFAQVASGQYEVEKGGAVVSVGCGQGNNPTEQKHLVTWLNRYKGPSNIECTGVPVQGRSGGGLFNKEGEVVGVCMAADEQGRRGLYVGLPAVQGFLKSCGLEELLKEGLSPDAEFDDQSDTVLAESNPKQPALRGVAALQAALGDDGQGVICVVKSQKNTQRGDRVIILSGRTTAERIETADVLTNSGRLRTTTMEK